MSCVGAGHLRRWHVFGGVLLGVGGLVLIGWFVVNLVMDGSMWGNKDYQQVPCERRRSVLRLDVVLAAQ